MAWFNITVIVLLACLMQGQTNPVEKVGIAQIATMTQSTMVYWGVNQELVADIELEVGVYGDKQRALQVEDWSSVGGVLSNKMSSLQNQQLASNSQLSSKRKNDLSLLLTLKDVITITVGPNQPKSVVISVDLDVFSNKRQNGTLF